MARRSGTPARTGPIGVRVASDPSNLGDDIPESGDLTHPSPINEPLGKSAGDVARCWRALRDGDAPARRSAAR